MRFGPRSRATRSRLVHSQKAWHTLNKMCVFYFAKCMACTQSMRLNVPALIVFADEICLTTNVFLARYHCLGVRYCHIDMIRHRILGFLGIGMQDATSTRVHNNGFCEPVYKFTVHMATSTFTYPKDQRNVVPLVLRAK